MGRVQVIKKSRKEYKCNKCGKVIPAGSTYYKGEINFGPTIIRCQECKLEAWEVTTSHYQLVVGEIVHKWADNYGISEDAIDNMVSDLQDIVSELEDKLSNMPEGLQEGDVGQLLQERIDTLEDVISNLGALDIDSMKEDVATEFAEGHLSEQEQEDEPTWDDIVMLKGEEAESAMEGMLNDALSDEIDSILSDIDV